MHIIIVPNKHGKPVKICFEGEVIQTNKSFDEMIEEMLKEVKVGVYTVEKSE